MAVVFVGVDGDAGNGNDGDDGDDFIVSVLSQPRVPVSLH